MSWFGEKTPEAAKAIACAMFVAAGSQLSGSEVYEKIFEEKDD